jgi:SAM-dependent methyltransferase
MNEVFTRLRLEIEDIQEEISSLDLNLTEGKIGDFGCGGGYSTLALSAVLKSSKSIGIDKNSQEIRYARDIFEKLLHEIPNIQHDQGRDDLQDTLQHLVQRHITIEFRVGDIITGQSLPTGLHLAYCKRLLLNIYRSQYGNAVEGEDGVMSAITNIAASVRPEGLVIVIEHAGIDFRPFLEQVGLVYQNASRMERYDIGSHGRITNSLVGKTQYIKYVYMKP